MRYPEKRFASSEPYELEILADDPNGNVVPGRPSSQGGTPGLTRRDFFVGAAALTGLLVSSALTPTQADAATAPTVQFRGHVQGIGWQKWASSGETSIGRCGTVGENRRLEAVQIKVSLPCAGSVSYCAHVQGIGWQSSVIDGATAGTSGQSRRIEALKIKLTGEAANRYDIWFRSYVQDIGWIAWRKNGAMTGTLGQSRRLEALEIKLQEKGTGAPSGAAVVMDEAFKVRYRTHIQGIGWQGWREDGATSGTTGQSRRLEAMKIELLGKPADGDIEYSTHIQGIGWQVFKKNGDLSGTTGQSRRIEAMKIRLTGSLAESFEVWYRAYAQGFGWLGWARNGDPAGSQGQSRRLEAMQVMIIEKGSAVPGSRYGAFLQNKASNLLAVAAAELNSLDWQKYATWYSQSVSGAPLSTYHQAWCGVFVSWVFNRAGIRCPGLPNAHVETILTTARAAGGTIIYNAREAQPGDVFLLASSARGGYYHVGIVQQNTGTELITIEGNTDARNTNGDGKVGRLRRTYAETTVLIRPNF